eukprot:CCRYP_001916-RA/>CCRYP_001916-RA protein AED:0.02 eAED:0.02 QI:592/1/1/1/1/1/2/340/646
MDMMLSHANNQPAFRGALFDASGACVNHPEVKLSQKVNLNGRSVYRELRRVCPKCVAGDCSPLPASPNKSLDTMNCASSLNRSAHSNFSNGTGGGGSTSTKSRRSEGSGSRGDRDGRGGPVKPASGGSVRSAHERRPSGTSESRPRSRSRSRPSSHSQQPHRRSEEEDSKSTTRSKSSQRQRAPSVGRNRTRKEYDTPFDSKGRCHYHVHVQLARKKLMGGWNVLLDNCPKCIEENYINDTSDNRSDTSGRSGRSNRTAKSSRSVRSTKSVSKGRPSSRSNHQFESPFDCNGYCNRHKYVRLAKKKTLGGWKIIQSFCPECLKEDSCADDNASARSGGSRHSRRSGHSKSSRVSKFSRRSGRSRNEEDETESAHSTSQSEQVRKRLVKKMGYRDAQTGEEGLYTGYVNGDYQPHGRGKIVYQNGERYDGTWCEGSKVHGKTSSSKSGNSHRSGRDEPAEGRTRDDNSASREKERSSSRRAMKKTDNNNTSHDGSATTIRTGTTAKENPKPQLRLQQQIDEYRDLYTDVFPIILETKTVKNMKFVDFYGDPGRYTGEVNEARMPHGMGEMTYDHGLVQGGKWVSAMTVPCSFSSSVKVTTSHRWTLLILNRQMVSSMKVPSFLVPGVLGNRRVVRSLHVNPFGEVVG